MPVLNDLVLPWCLMLSFVGLVLATPAAVRDVDSNQPAADTSPQTEKAVSFAGLYPESLSASHRPSTSGDPLPPLPSSTRRRGVPRRCKYVSSIEPRLRETLDSLREQLLIMDPPFKTAKQMEAKKHHQYEAEDLDTVKHLAAKLKKYAEDMACAIEEEYEMEEQPDTTKVDMGKSEVLNARFQVQRVERLLGL